jgi:hypothetical protein
MEISDILSSVGCTQESFLDRLVDQCATKILETRGGYDNKFTEALRAEIQARIDAAINAFGEQYVAPLALEHIKALVIERTNQYGEKNGESFTLLEYMVDRAEKYITEEVDSNGRNQAECNARRDSFYRKGTRISQMIDQYLYLSTDTAMKKALEGANATIAKGLMGQLKISLEKAMNEVGVAVTVKK